MSYDISDYKMAPERAKPYAINGIGPHEAALRERIVQRLEKICAAKNMSARKYAKDVLGFSHTVVSTFMGAPWTKSENVLDAMAERDPLNFADINGMVSLERSRDKSPSLHGDQHSTNQAGGIVLRPAELQGLLELIEAMKRAAESIESKLRQSAS